MKELSENRHKASGLNVGIVLCFLKSVYLYLYRMAHRGEDGQNLAFS